MKKETTIVIIVLVVLAVFGLYLGGGSFLNFGKNGIIIEKNVLVDSYYSSKYGSYLTDNKGITLYIYTLDERLESKCGINCQKTWKPFTYDRKNLEMYKDKLSQRLNVIRRDDGSSQYAYGTKPLYYFIGDKTPGDIKGLTPENRDWEIVTANN